MVSTLYLSIFVPIMSKSVGTPELKAGPIPEGSAGVLVRCPTNRPGCSYQISVTKLYKHHCCLQCEHQLNVKVTAKCAN